MSREINNKNIEQKDKHSKGFMDFWIPIIRELKEIDKDGLTITMSGCLNIISNRLNNNNREADIKAVCQAMKSKDQNRYWTDRTCEWCSEPLKHKPDCIVRTAERLLEEIE